MLPTGMNPEDPVYLAASQFDWIYVKVLRSQLQAKEKSAGQRILENLKRAIILDRISPAAVENLNNHLVHLVTLVAANPSSTTAPQAWEPMLSDNNLRRFLGFAEIELSRVAAIQNRSADQVNIPKQNPGHTDEFINKVEALMKDPGVRHFLNSYK